MSRLRGLDALLLALASIGCADSKEAGPSSGSVLLITIDTARADALSCYGAPDGLTPNLDRIADAGVLYERAYSCVPLTLPSHATMLTGLYPPRHSVRVNGVQPLPTSARTLAEAANDAGYRTAAFVAAVVLDAAFGLDQGFQTYDAPDRRAREGVADNHLTERSAGEMVDIALAWFAQQDAGAAWFVWLHLFDPHHPYRAPSRFQARAPGHPYRAEMAYADHEIGRLLGRLEERGQLEGTTILVVADHGESLAEHDEPTHGSFCYQSTIHVPFLVRRADGLRAGERSREIVSVADVAPTLAAAMGVELPADVDGRSLLDLRDEADQGVYVESYYGYLSYGWSPLAGWLDAGGKYLHSSDPEFFDLDADPREAVNRFSSSDVERYRAAIDRIVSRPALELDGDFLADPELLESIGNLGYASAAERTDNLPHPLAPTKRPSPVSMAREQLRVFEGVRIMNERGDAAGARRVFAEVLRSNPDNYFALDKLGTCLLREGRPLEAIDILRRVTAEGPQWAQTYVHLGVCLRFAERDEEALQVFRRAVEIDENSYAALGALYKLLEDMGRVDEAAPIRKRFEELGGRR